MFQAPASCGQRQHREVPQAHPCKYCQAGTAPATPERWLWCWMAGCRYSMRDAIIASQEAPPSPASLRSRNATSPAATIPTHDPELVSKPLVTTLDLPGANPDQEDARAAAIEDPDVAGLRVVASPRRPTFLQQERWKAVQQAKLQGMFIRRMARELGIHRDTVRRYIDAETPPTRRTPAIPPPPASDTIAD